MWRAGWTYLYASDIGRFQQVYVASYSKSMAFHVVLGLEP